MSKKEIKPEKVTLSGFEIVYGDGIKYGKDGVTVSVTIDLMIDGKIFTHKAYMWPFEVSNYLSKYGGEI